MITFAALVACACHAPVPSNVRFSNPSASVQLPSLSTVSVPPASMSTSPAVTTYVSLPRPPSIVSMPLPPSSESSPPLPTSESLPSRPLIVSLPEPPVSVSLPAVPLIVLPGGGGGGVVLPLTTSMFVAVSDGAACSVAMSCAAPKPLPSLSYHTLPEEVSYTTRSLLSCPAFAPGAA